MEFRKANRGELSPIMNIIKEAQAYFKEQGIDQWQNNYPNLGTIKNDIDNKNAHILLKDNTIVGTVAVVFGIEKTYESIYQGDWKSQQDYAVIHRMAVAAQHKGSGLSSIMINHIEEICLGRGIRSIRVDTHKENTSMQKLLQKNKFDYCGIIYLEDGGERIAFEKIL